MNPYTVWFWCCIGTWVAAAVVICASWPKRSQGTHRPMWGEGDTEYQRMTHVHPHTVMPFRGRERKRAS